MREIFNSLTDDLVFNTDIAVDSYNLLVKYNRYKIAEHSQRVARKANDIASKYEADEKSAETAGLLHDIGGIYPYDQRIEISNMLKINVLPEEEELPLILHQKISAAMAKEIFNINNNEVLSAINCHTTLKKDATKMDMILFIADKIEWDQDGIPPYLDSVENALENSLEAAAFTYIDYLLNSPVKLKVLHPWLAEAYSDLKTKLNKE